MQTGFNALRDLLKEPIRTDGGVKTDSSVLLDYPPVRELDFREHLLPQVHWRRSSRALPEAGLACEYFFNRIYYSDSVLSGNHPMKHDSSSVSISAIHLDVAFSELQ